MDNVNSSYMQTFDDARAELESIFAEESRMEERREKLEHRKDRLIQIVKAISQFLGEDFKQQTGITNVIREVLNDADGDGLTPADVRNRLHKMDFEIDAYSNPLAVVHTTLKRLVKQGELESKRINGKTRYYRVEK